MPMRVLTATAPRSPRARMATGGGGPERPNRANRQVRGSSAPRRRTSSQQTRCAAGAGSHGASLYLIKEESCNNECGKSRFDRGEEDRPHGCEVLRMPEQVVSQVPDAPSPQLVNRCRRADQQDRRGLDQPCADAGPRALPGWPPASIRATRRQTRRRTVCADPSATRDHHGARCWISRMARRAMGTLALAGAVGAARSAIAERSIPGAPRSRCDALGS